MLWLILDAAPSIDVRIETGGESRLLHADLDEMIAWWKRAWPGINLEEIHIDHVFAPGWDDMGFWEQYHTFEGEWDKYVHSAGEWDGVFLGLRGGESNKRRMALNRFRQGRYPIWKYSDNRSGASAGCYRICPLEDWTEDDIAALHAIHSIPLLAAYEIEGIESRTKLRIGKTAMQYGQLRQLRVRDQGAYNRLIQRFPELGEYAS